MRGGACVGQLQCAGVQRVRVREIHSPITRKPQRAMTLYIEGQDTRVEVELWCPVCEPERDPILEVISPRLCNRHRDEEIAEITTTRTMLPSPPRCTSQ